MTSLDEKQWMEFCSLIETGVSMDAFIQSLLDAGLHVNVWNKNGSTMLHYAAECGNMEIIKYLVQKGAEGYVTNIDGCQPIHIAAKNGHKEMVQFFLDKNIYINGVNRDTLTPLLIAVESHKKEMVEFLIKANANIEHKGKNSRTTLHYACVYGWLDVVKLLVSKKCNLNAKDNDGNVPLILAARNCHENVFEFLIQSGADVNCHEQTSGKWTALHYGCHFGWMNAVKSLVMKKCNLNAKDNDGNVPLFLAAENSHENVFEFLIQSGADVNCREQKSRKWSALHYACHFGWLKAVISLVMKKCDINSKSSNGDSPLFLAVSESHSLVVEYLVECGVNVEFSGGENCWTLLHHAASEGWAHVVSLVINKCNINSQGGGFCHTPLHVAVRYAHFKVIELLVKAGADFSVRKNGYDRTAFNECILSHFCLDSISLFIEHGAYFQFCDYDTISNNPELKEAILKDVQLCTQAAINKFNNSDLPKIYEIPAIAKMLPPIEKLKIVNYTNVARVIADNINYEIQTKGFCNVLNVCPIGLTSWCIRSLVQHYNI